MPFWRRICCPVDLSEAARAALRDAAEVTRTSGAELTLLHVYAPVHKSMIAVDPLTPEVEELVKTTGAALERELQPWKEEASRLAERPVSLAVVPGVPADEIVRFARERGFDLIVMATHGRTGVRRLVLGSVTEHVVREASVPVLVVRAPPA